MYVDFCVVNLDFYLLLLLFFGGGGVGWPWDFSFRNELSLFHYHSTLYWQLPHTNYIIFRNVEIF